MLNLLSTVAVVINRGLILSGAALLRRKNFVTMTSSFKPVRQSSIKESLSASAVVDSFKLNTITLQLRRSLSESSSMAPTAFSGTLSGAWAECEIEFSASAVSVIWFHSPAS